MNPSARFVIETGPTAPNLLQFEDGMAAFCHYLLLCDLPQFQLFFWFVSVRASSISLSAAFVCEKFVTAFGFPTMLSNGKTGSGTNPRQETGLHHRGPWR